jgi:hypothetical protein
MTMRARAFVLGMGLVGLLLVALLLGGVFRTPANAQAPAALPQAVGRYQLSSFSYAWGNGTTCGAYILDTQTGDVFQVVGKEAPELIGSVTRPRAKK